MQKRLLEALYCDHGGELGVLAGLTGFLDSWDGFCFVGECVSGFFQKSFPEIFLTPEKYFPDFFCAGKIFPGFFPGIKFIFHFALTGALRAQTKTRFWMTTVRANSKTRKRTVAVDKSGACCV